MLTKNDEKKYSEMNAEEITYEDILRILYERGGSERIDRMAEEIGEPELVLKIIGRLEKENLVEKREDSLSLTKEGEKKASIIYKSHEIVEDAFKKLGYKNPHLAAHALEHLRLSPSVINKLFQKGLVIARLEDLREGESGYILLVEEKKPNILSRMYGVGVVPGKRVLMVSKSMGIIFISVDVGGRVVALDRRVAGKVLVNRL